MEKKVTIIGLALSFLSFAGFSQQGKIQPCNTYEAMEQRFAQDPEARKNYEKFQQEFSTLLQQNSQSASRPAAAFEYTVPVVFHVLYDCSNQNTGITEAVCVAALQQINKDYARQGSDTAQVAQPFRSLYINSDIKFMMARRDPSGNCINGVVRHYDSKTTWSQASAGNSGAYWTHTWDPTKYLNVYVVTSIVPQGPVTGGGTVVGYTYKPGTWPTGSPLDAIVYDGNYLTGNGPGSIPRVRSLSHEMGHWLNLAHTWGNTNNPNVSCGDDGISDTPITKGEFGGCASSSVSACTQINPAMTGFNNVQNIMNYSDCPRNFTTGQTNAMRTILGNPINGRNNLWSPANIAFTNVDGTSLCSPVADFISTNCSFTVCSGSSLTFRDMSYNGTIASYNWSGDNGATIQNATASLTSISFPNPGLSNITLTVTNASGSSFKTVAVTVLNGQTSIIGPYSESFEASGTPTDWSVTDVQNDGVTWMQTNSAAYDQSNSFMIDGTLNPANNVDILEMPVLDIKNNPNSILQFAYAYRKYSATHSDAFKVQASKDCGGSWADVYVPNMTTFANTSGGVSSEVFIPFSNEWATYNISGSPFWPPFKTSTSVIVRFQFTEGAAGFGNNLYLDAINFSVPVGVNELTRSISFNLFPNPTSGETNVGFTLNDPATIKITVLDILGREVLPAIESKYGVGEQTIRVNKDNSLAKGVYFVNLSFNGAKMSSKLVID